MDTEPTHLLVAVMTTGARHTSSAWDHQRAPQGEGERTQTLEPDRPRSKPCLSSGQPGGPGKVLLSSRRTVHPALLPGSGEAH